MSLHLAPDSFATKRLTAERIAPEHFGVLRQLHGDPNVMKTLSPDGLPLPEEATRQSVVDAVDHWGRHGFGFWVFRERSAGAFVGRGGLKYYRIDGLDVVGLAYAVVSERFGQGFATEMAAASLEVGFDWLGLPQVDSWTLPINRASQRVMEKLGFRYSHDTVVAGLPHRHYTLLASKTLSGTILTPARP